MNLISKSLIDIVINSADVMRESISKALSDYREEIGKETAISKRYKAEEEYLAGQKAKHSAIARDAILKAQRVFRNKAEEVARQMEGELKKHLHEPVNAEFRDKLSMINDFNLQPERFDVEDLISLANGNQVALSALAATLTKVKSPYVLSFHSTADYQADIEALRSMVRNLLYIPAGYEPEGIEVFKGQQFDYTYPNGNKIGRILGTAEILAYSNGFVSQLSAIEKMKDVWTADCSYRAADDEVEAQAMKTLQDMGIEPEDLPKSGISVKDTNSAMQLAYENAAHDNENAKISQKVMEIYVR